MTKRILLVSPLRNYTMDNEMYPSGALLMLGTILKKHGHTVKVIHMVADGVDVAGYRKLLWDFHPDIVGFTVSTYQTKITKVLLDIVKKHNSEILTLVGGSHPTALGADFLNEFPGTDIVVCGEGEDTMLKLAGAYPLSATKGTHYRVGSIINSTEKAELLPNLDKLPMPDKSLIDFSKYSGLFPVGKRPAMFIMSSRGCPYSCTFCSKSIYGNTLRLRSPANIMDEVEMLYEDWGVREVHFGDDTFNANRAWADELLDRIIGKGYQNKMVFRVALRVNEKILDRKLLRHLKRAGIWLACYGVESGNQDMLDSMRKDITIKEIKRAFALTHEVGIKTEAYFIIGMPGETLATIQDSYNLYKDIKPYWGGFSRAMPFPGTAFTEEVRNTGHLLCDNYDEFGPSMMAVDTDTLSAEELILKVDSLNMMARFDKMKHPKQLAYAIRDKAFGKRRKAI